MSKPTKKELDQRRRERTKANREKREKAKKRSGQIINIQVVDEMPFTLSGFNSPPPPPAASSMVYSPGWMHVNAVRNQLIEALQIENDMRTPRHMMRNR